MEETRFTFRANDSQVIEAKEWRDAAADPTRALVLVHGLGEHSGRYLWFAEQLVNAGFIIYTFDLRGHGLTVGPRGHISSYDHLMDDIAQILDETRKRHPSLPLFLYGHSLGGNLVMNFCLRRKPQLTGVIASSPGLRTAEKPAAWKTSIGRMMYKIYPGFSMDNGLKVNGLSHDPAVIEKYTHDPLVHKYISARLGIDLIDSGAWAQQHASEFTLPLLMVQGGSDPIVDPDTNRQFAKAVSGDITYRDWKEEYHELLNENVRGDVVQTILEWVNEHTPVKSVNE